MILEVATQVAAKIADIAKLKYQKQQVPFFLAKNCQIMLNSAPQLAAHLAGAVMLNHGHSQKYNLIIIQSLVWPKLPRLTVIWPWLLVFLVFRAILPRFCLSPNT